MDLEAAEQAAKTQALNYLSSHQLGRDEELQLLSCGYTLLFVQSCKEFSLRSQILGIGHVSELRKHSKQDSSDQ